jgi:hypothetical protein
MRGLRSLAFESTQVHRISLCEVEQLSDWALGAAANGFELFDSDGFRA